MMAAPHDVDVGVDSRSGTPQSPQNANSGDPRWHTWNGQELEPIEAMPRQTLRVFCGVWNLCGKPAPSDIKPFLPQGIRHHIYAIATCECERSIGQSFVYASKARWEKQVCTYLGEEYKMVGSHTLNAIHLMVLAHRSLWQYIWDVRTACVATGFANVVGNKGGAQVAFRLAQTSFLFAGAHLTAHAEKMEQRTQNLARILQDSPLRRVRRYARNRLDHSPERRRMSRCGGDSPQRIRPCSGPGRLNGNGNRRKALDLLPVSPVATRTSVLSSPQSVPHRNSREREFAWAEVPRPKMGILDEFDRVFLMGDLNPRVNMTRADADASIAARDFNSLLEKDQLLQLLHGSNSLWSSFQEMKITFAPTYKFDAGTDQYDSSKKQRVPSWTDRVLWKRDDFVRGLAYDSVESLKVSDHRPVVSQFEVTVNFENWSKPQVQPRAGSCAVQ